MHIRGELNLAPERYGWASGGYIADSKIDGQVGPCSQQQWFTRDSSDRQLGTAEWNMVFAGVQGAPANSFPSPPYTTSATTPVVREKPYLYLDARQLPGVRARPAHQRHRHHLGERPDAGHVAADRPVLRRQAGATGAPTINAALACGQAPAVHARASTT